jgi:hypothetical protein
MNTHIIQRAAGAQVVVTAAIASPSFTSLSTLLSTGLAYESEKRLTLPTASGLFCEQNRERERGVMGGVMKGTELEGTMSPVIMPTEADLQPEQQQLKLPKQHQRQHQSSILEQERNRVWLGGVGVEV